MKKTYVSPEFEVIDMMIEGDILIGSGEKEVEIYDDNVMEGASNALSPHRSFPWSEEEE